MTGKINEMCSDCKYFTTSPVEYPCLGCYAFNKFVKELPAHQIVGGTETMLKLKTSVEFLTECAEAIVGVVDEAVLTITKNGLEVNAVDPANVAMVSLKLPHSCFEHFEFESPEELKIGIDFANLSRVLKSWKWETTVELELHEKKLSIKSGIFDYSISGLEQSSLRREPRDPEITFAVDVGIKTELFIEAIRTLKLVCDDFVSVCVKDEELYILTEGERGTLKAVLGQLIIPSNIGDVCSSHPIEYLSAICSGMHTETIKLSLRTDYPIRFDFDILGKGKVSYLLAPRIPPEEDKR